MIDKIQFPSLMKEMLDYAIKGKAEVVYWECLAAGKYVLADKIKRKYGLIVNTHDSVIAMGIALHAAKNLKS